MKYADLKRKVQPYPLFSTSMLGVLTDQVETLKVQLCRWKRQGLVWPLRKGLYVLGPDDRRVEPTVFYLANQMFPPSYVSLESALAYYGLIPEWVSATTSVTVRKTCRFENAFGIFTYQHVRPAGFDGFQALQESACCSALVATPEKAVADFLYFNLPRLHLSDRSVFVESYRFQNCDGLNATRLRAQARRFGVNHLNRIVERFCEEMLR
jgi:hypothetical protein